MWVIHAVEVNPPAGVEPIEWILLTSMSVESFEERLADHGLLRETVAHRGVAQSAEDRLPCGVPAVEMQGRFGENHRIAERRGLRLLQLKSEARTNPDRQARQIVPMHWIRMLVAARKRLKDVTATTMTVGQFYRELAKLGGFLGRKSDGEPGWITIWRGWQQLYLLVRGAEIAANVR